MTVRIINLKNLIRKYKKGLDVGGFTLIELLIVIAILGTLAVVVLLALNPVQQLARTRDAGRISGVTQLGHAIEAYATTRGGTYPPSTGAGCTPATWIDCLVDAGEIQTVPAGIAYSTGITGCTAAGGAADVNDFCYITGAAGATVFARMESSSQNSRCVAATPDAYAVYSTVDGRGGVVCRATGAQPVVGQQTFLP